MFNNSQQRIGFCCKYLHPNQNQPKRVLEELQRPLNTRGTTVQWLNRQTQSDAEQRLWEIMQHNIQSALRLIQYVGSLPPAQRMVRLGSDMLPMYTEPKWGYFWRKPDVIRYCETEFAWVGEYARQHDVRLSFHPGQFCVLASENDDIVQRSIDEFEYHVDMARWMGYGSQFQDFKINVHISGRRGAQGIIDVLGRLSPEARNTLTIENDEMCWGLDESLKLVDHCALVLDIHHHLIREAEYIQPSDSRVAQVIDSWRGVRPALHYSYSRCEHLPEGAHDALPDVSELLAQNYKKQKLRAHSDMYPNTSANSWALSFWPYFDLQCEAKSKNLASTQLYQQALAQWR